MKIRIIALVLCLITVLPFVLAGCGSDEDISNANQNDLTSRPTESVVIYMIKEEGTTDEDIAIVEKAFNEITKSKFKTQVKLEFYTKDVYYEKLEEAMLKSKERKDALNNSYYEETTADPDAEVTEEETILNEYGLPELKYPAFEDGQVDIFYFGGYNRYLDYTSIEKEWLVRLDSELSTSSKKLKDYIYPSFLKAAALSGKTYAIPNNNVIGEYTFLLLNKKLIDTYSYSASDIMSMGDAMPFINDVMANNKDEYDPIAYDSYKGAILTHYWSIDPEEIAVNSSEFSLVGSSYSIDATYGTVLSFASLFTRTAYTDQLKTLKYLQTNGYYAAEDSEKDFAVSMVKGGADVIEKYSDEYYVNIIDYPRATNEILYANMLGVSSFSLVETSRLMEIITYLNTNSDLRNLLQYGVENVHYVVNEDGKTITRVDDCGYIMDINKTGNVFMAYPEEGMSADVWKYAKIQNQDSKEAFFLKFNFSDTVDQPLNLEAIKAVQEASKEAAAELAAVESYDDFVAKLDEFAARYKASSPLLQKYLSPNREGEDEKKYPYSQYYQWLLDNKFIVEEE